MASLQTVVLLLCFFLRRVMGDGPQTKGTLEDCRGQHCENLLPDKEADVSNTFEDREDGSDVFCRPDENGYIGSTTGTSYVVPYAFGLETETNLQTEQLIEILRAVKVSIEDLLIGYYFPQVCRYNRKFQRFEGSHVSGFQFETEMDLISVACEPLHAPQTVCGIYEGLIEVFGFGGGVLPLIEDYLNGDDTDLIHPDIIRIFSADTSSPTTDNDIVEEEDPVNNPDPEPVIPEPVVPEPGIPSGLSAGSVKPGGSSLSGGAIAGIVISMMVLVIGIAGYVYFDRKRRRSRPGAANDSTTNSQVYLDNNSAFASEDLRSIPTVNIEDGRPVLIENQDLLKD